MSIDQRLQNLVSIEGGPRLVIGAPSGGLDAALNRSSATLAKAMTQLRQRAAEIRGHSQLLPSEQTRRLEELRHPAIAAARAHQQTLKVEKARIEHLSRTASPVKSSAQVAGHVLLEDQMLCARFAAMDIGQRTQLTARATSDPQGNARWVEMLLRWPVEVTGVDPAMHQQLRSAAMEAFSPAEAEAIRVQLEQVEFAARADNLAQQVLAETLPGSIQELREAPPEPEKPARIEFTPEELLAAVPAHVVADLLAGPGLSRPSRIEMQGQA